MGVVTLYVGDTSLRLLVAQGKRVSKWAELPLEAGLVKDGVVIDEAKVADKIKELLEAQKVRTTKVIAGMSGLHCLFRVITLPRLSASLLAEAIRLEAERVIPVPLKQLYLSWQVILTAGEEITVFLAVFPQDAADSLIRTLRLAALDPYLIDLKPLALARVVDRSTAIIADTQATEVDIVVMVGGVPQLIRTLSLPPEAQSWPEKLSLIREELDRTLKFYNSSHPENPLDASIPIYVSGDMEQESEVCASLTDELGYSVSPLVPPLQYPEGLAAGQYTVNIGLVLKVVSLPRAEANLSVVNLNIQPEVYRPKAHPLTGFLAVPGIVIAVGLLAFLVMMVQNIVADVASLGTELDVTNQLLSQRQVQIQGQMADIAQLEEKVSEVVASADALNAVLTSFSDRRIEVTGDLVAATHNLPGSVDLSSLTYSHGLTIAGVAPSEDAIFIYAENLRDEGRFSEVIISSMKEREDGMSFALLLTR